MDELLVRVQAILKSEDMVAEIAEDHITTRIRCGMMGAELTACLRTKTFEVRIILGLFCPKDRHAQMAEAVCRANFGLAMGGFEFDFSDGEVRFRNAIPRKNTVIDDQMLNDLLFGSWSITASYASALFEVATGAAKPEEAIERSESGKKHAAKCAAPETTVH